jgi:4-hydroxythreonine-4-phosphate dehydrogenase
MPPDFIFMLTRADRTVMDAEERLGEALDVGIRHIGFKDIGLPRPALSRLAAAIRRAGARVYLEVVSLDAASEAASAQTAVELEIDVLMGGTRPEIVAPIIAGTPIRYHPFPGEIVGHPSELRGTIDSIVASARMLLEHEGVHGLDLLAYRFDGNAPELARRVCAAAGARPVVVAGSLDRLERIEAVAAAGAAGFTVGTAIFENAFACPPGLRSQLAFVQGAIDRRRIPPDPRAA